MQADEEIAMPPPCAIRSAREFECIIIGPGQAHGKSASTQPLAYSPGELEDNLLLHGSLAFGPRILSPVSRVQDDVQYPAACQDFGRREKWRDGAVRIHGRQ